MTKAQNFGLGTALITPFRKDGSIDFKTLSNQVEEQIAGNVDYLVALGTTSEAATLTQDERIAVVNLIIEVNNGRKPILLGVGGNNTRAVVEEIHKVSNEIWGILSVAPYYNKPSQKGIYEHFKMVAMATAKPIVLYNVPGRTAKNMTAETTLELASDFQNIIGIKEASGDMVQIMEIIRRKPDGFQVISGDDALTMPLIAAGATGVISVVSNAYPAAFAEMVHLSLAGDFKKARRIHNLLLPFISAIFEDGNPAGVKLAMENMGRGLSNVRLPLVKVQKSTSAKLRLLVEELKEQL
ncbi:MAG: 4-hydroxy-tetrahydrodipicolinate synthase [Salinivirgaceae bacterium]|nr:4-hydroxy-tetrahydrodipicolinate synthase [Salinivirgaceae bacterium]